MSASYLSVSYRDGKPFAAYFFLPRSENDHAAKTKRFGKGLIVDYAEDGRPIGVEITSPKTVDLAELARLLEQLGFGIIDKAELAPLGSAA